MWELGIHKRLQVSLRVGQCCTKESALDRRILMISEQYCYTINCKGGAANELVKQSSVCLF